MEPILAGSKSVMSGHTLSANPQSCAVSLAVLEYLDKNKILKEVENKSVYLKNQLEKLKLQFSFIGDIRGKGLLLGIEFVMDPVQKPHLLESPRLHKRSSQWQRTKVSSYILPVRG